MLLFSFVGPVKSQDQLLKNTGRQPVQPNISNGTV